MTESCWQKEIVKHIIVIFSFLLFFFMAVARVPVERSMGRDERWPVMQGESDCVGSILLFV